MALQLFGDAGSLATSLSNLASGNSMRATQASAMSSLCSISRRGLPVPHSVTAFAPLALASWNLRMNAGRTCECCGS